jgi:hypothetical protein
MQYKIFAGEIVATLETHGNHLVKTVEFFASTFTSYTISRNVTWPYVALPNFVVRGQYVDDLAHTLQIGLVPLVTEENRYKYQEYALDHQDWIHEGLIVQNHDPIDIKYLPNISSFIHKTIPNDDSDDTAPIEVDEAQVNFGPADYAPIWQQAPAPLNPSQINFDLFQLDSFRRAYRSMWQSGSASLTQVTDSHFYCDDYILDRETDPHSFLVQPIYPNFSNTSEASFQANDLIGFLYAAFSWRVMLQKSLRNGTFSNVSLNFFAPENLMFHDAVACRSERNSSSSV